MPIDAGLINALMPRVRSVQDYQDDYTRRDIQAQGLQRNALLLQESQALQQDRTRTRMEQDGLNNALRGLGGNATPEQVIAAARGVGNRTGYDFADAQEKGWLERQKTQSTIGKTVQETDSGAFKLRSDKDGEARKLIQTAQDPQHAMELVVGAVRNGLWSEDDARQFISRMPQEAQQFAQWKPQQLAPALSAKELLPTLGSTNLGGSEQYTARNPLTGAVSVSGTAKRSMTPGEVSRLGEDQRQFGVTSGLAERKFGYDREKDAQARTDGTKVLPAKQKIDDATEVLSLLDTAEALLPGATSSYAGTAIDEAARVVGMGTSGAQSGARLKALEGALISKMPKMSGPQSDKDVLLYKQMAGQIGDSTMPASTRKAAIETIREMNRRYAGLPSEAAPAAPSAGYSDAEKERRYQEFKRSQGR